MIFLVSVEAVLTKSANDASQLSDDCFKSVAS